MPAARRSPEARVVVVFALALFALYGALLGWLPDRALWGGDQAMKFLQIEALAGSPPRVSLEYAGSTLAPEDRFSPFNKAHAFRHEGRWYSVFPLAYAAFTVLPYRAFGFVGLYMIPIASVIAAALLAYALARQLSGTRDAILAMSLTALGSPLFVYGAVLWEHALATALAAGAVLCAARNGNGGTPRALVAAGLLVGVATWVRTEMYVFIAASAIALVFAGNRPWRTGWFVAAAIAALIPLWALNAVLYGDVAGAHISYNFAGEQTSLVARLTRHFAIRRAVAGDFVPLDGSIWWIAYSVAACGAFILWRQVGSSRLGVGAVALASLFAAGAAATDLSRDVFVISLLAACPWVVLLAGLPAARGHAESVRFLLISSLGYVALVVVFSPVPGGVHWGGRMLLPIVPSLAVLAVMGRARLFGDSALLVRTALRLAITVAIGTALAAGVLVQIGGIRSLHTFKYRNQVFADAIIRTDDPVFVASARWPVLAAAPVWGDRIFLRADTKDDFCTLVSRFADARVPSFTYLAVPFARNVSRARCVGSAGYRIGGRSKMRPGSVIRGVHFKAQNPATADPSRARASGAAAAR